MKAAITGIETVRDNFRHLGESLDPLIKAIDKIESGTSAALLAIRKSNISHGIKDALAKYDEVCGPLLTSSPQRAMSFRCSES